MEKSKLGQDGHAMVILYFLSLDKPEFSEYAQKLSVKTTRKDCNSIAWQIMMDKGDPNAEIQKLMAFLRENCIRNKWDITEWLKIQSKVSKLLHLNKVISGI